MPHIGQLHIIWRGKGKAEGRRGKREGERARLTMIISFLDPPTSEVGPIDSLPLVCSFVGYQLFTKK